MFKHFVLFLSIAMVATMANAYDFMVDGLCYNYNSDGESVTITYEKDSSPRYKSIIGDVIIPETVNYNNISYAVTTIDKYAFHGCIDLTNVTIPSSVTSIGNSAFYSCSGLSSVVIGNSVTEIGNAAFSFCRNLKNVIIPNSVTDIGEWAFYNTGVTRLSLGSSVKSIGWGAFSGCTDLTNVIIPNSVITIAENAFRGSGITKMSIPSSVTTIGADAFYNCNGFTALALTGFESWNYNSSQMKGLKTIISQIKTLNIGCGINDIGSFGFAPDVVNCYASTPPVCTENTFSSYDGALHVPSSAAVAYMTTDYWQNFININFDANDNISLDESAVNLTMGEKLALNATVIPVGEATLWSSSNSNIASVSEDGIVTALTPGECDILVTLASNPAVYASCHVEVNGTVIVSLNMLKATITPNQILTLIPSCNPDVEVDFTVSSSNPTVAFARLINRNNAPISNFVPALANSKAVQVVGLSEGLTTITIGSETGDVTPASCEVTVRTVTDIDKINIDQHKVQRYNLQGIPVDEDFHGIVIENGRKIIDR